MNFTSEILNKTIDIQVIKKIRNRHTYLRIKSSNLLEISSHIFFTINDAKELIEKKKSWIEQHIISLEKKAKEEGIYRYLGQIYDLDLSSKELEEFYRKKAKEIIPKLVDKHSINMNLYPSSIKFRKNKNTWGSCNYKNGLNFNILLMKFPLEIIEYVVIHELAHIKHKNHSKRFWNLVEIYCTDYKQRIKLFKTLL
ncbi:MAG: M48 family peptidase [Arcobacter sp.]|nr:MAG: M48 family peptidase [Arcobacter sp.]